MSEKCKIKIKEVIYASLEINNCVRCGENHKDLSLYKIENKPILKRFQFWTICPLTRDPILVEGKNIEKNIEEENEG